MLLPCFVGAVSVMVVAKDRLTTIVQRVQNKCPEHDSLSSVMVQI